MISLLGTLYNLYFWAKLFLARNFYLFTNVDIINKIHYLYKTSKGNFFKPSNEKFVKTSKEKFFKTSKENYVNTTKEKFVTMP